jgi:hypothetical protein
MRTRLPAVIVLFACGSLLPAQAPSEEQTEKLFGVMLDNVATRQGKDGSWRLSDVPGKERPMLGTGLCLLALMSSGSSLDIGKYRPAIQAATTWLRTNQAKDGWLADDPADLEAHAIATCALFRAFGMSGAPKSLREPTVRAIQILVARATQAGASPSPGACGFAAHVLPRAKNFQLPTDVELVKRWGSKPAPAASRPGDELVSMAELWCRVAAEPGKESGERDVQLLAEAQRLTLTDAAGQRPCDARAHLFAGLAAMQLFKRGKHPDARAAWCKRIDESIDPKQKGLDRFKLLMQPSSPWAEGIGETGRLALATYAVGLRVFHAQIVD